MEQKINHLQNCILAGFVVIYGVSLAINAIMSIFGKATLAVWHWGPFVLMAAFAWESLPVATRCRYIIYARRLRSWTMRLARKVAKLMIDVLCRALRNLPALKQA